MVGAKMLVGMVFSGSSALVIEGIEDTGEVIVVHASTRGGAVECPACGTLTRRVHAFQERMPADVPVDGRRVLLRMRVAAEERPGPSAVEHTPGTPASHHDLDRKDLPPPATAKTAGKTYAHRI
jgi:hypothetical protein